MASLKIELKKKLESLLKEFAQLNPIVQVDSVRSGVIHFDSNEYDRLATELKKKRTKVYYNWERSTSCFERFKLFIQLDWDGVFKSMHEFTFEVEE